jgi:hypothetical protein
MKPSPAAEDAAWDRFQRLAETKREVTDEDLRAIMAAVDGNGHSPAAEGGDDAHVADALRHMIFG